MHVCVHAGRPAGDSRLHTKGLGIAHSADAHLSVTSLNDVDRRPGSVTNLWAWAWAWAYAHVGTGTDTVGPWPLQPLQPLLGHEATALLSATPADAAACQHCAAWAHAHGRRGGAQGPASHPMRAARQHAGDLQLGS